MLVLPGAIAPQDKHEQIVYIDAKVVYAPRNLANTIQQLLRVRILLAEPRTQEHPLDTIHALTADHVPGLFIFHSCTWNQPAYESVRGLRQEQPQAGCLLLLEQQPRDFTDFAAGLHSAGAEVLLIRHMPLENNLRHKVDCARKLARRTYRPFLGKLPANIY